MTGFLTGLLILGAAGTTLAACVVSQRRLVAQLASRFRALPKAQQALVVFAVGVLVAWAGTKPEGIIIELSNNRIIESADGARLSSVGAALRRRPQDGTSEAVGAVLSLQGLEGQEGREGREGLEAEEKCLSNHSPPQASTSTIVSLFWHLLTPSNTLVLTWQNALLERETANPVSFQAELFPNGNIVFRYDLARIGDEGLLTNVVVAVKGREGLEEEKITFTRALTSLSFKTARTFSAMRNERNSTTRSAVSTRSSARPARRTRSGNITSTRARRTARSPCRRRRRRRRFCA